MISRKYKSDELVGKKCYPMHPFQNGAGKGVTPLTECIITSAHYGITIKTEPCPCCGQYTSISRVAREDLVLDDDVLYTVYVWEHVNRKALGLFPWSELDKKDAKIVGRFDRTGDMSACVSRYEGPDTVVGVWKSDPYINEGKGYWFD